MDIHPDLGGLLPYIGFILDFGTFANLKHGVLESGSSLPSSLPL